MLKNKFVNLFIFIALNGYKGSSASMIIVPFNIKPFV